MNGKYLATVKTGKGIQRGEIEIELSGKQFNKLWRATRGRRLEKLWYTLKWQARKIELDVYKRELSGLMVAEVEFKTKRQAKDFSPLPWFGREVTDDEKFKNRNLATQNEK
jgi:CYTH domain-containing protein